MTIIQTEKAPEAIGPYSQAIKISRWVYTSGQIGIEPDTGRLVQSSFSDEVKQVLANVKAVLKAGECEMKDIVKTTVFLIDMGNFKEFNALYAEAMGEHKPARSTVQVAALPLGAQIEIEAVAIVP